MSKGKNKTNYMHREGVVSLATQPDYDFLYEASTSKDPKWGLGDRVVLGDGRVFRYAKCGKTLGSMKVGVCGYNPLVAGYATPTCVPTNTIAVGDKSAAFTVSTGAIGVSRNGIIAEDELRGGYISFYGTTSGDRPQRGIIGNTALAAAGISITIYFDAAIKTAMNAGVATEILANPYSDVRTAEEASGYASVLGMPNVLATTGQYFWIQTWGIFRVSPIGAALPGVSDTRLLMFTANGGIRTSQASIVTQGMSEQIAGFLVECNSAPGYAAPFINLQINP